MKIKRICRLPILVLAALLCVTMTPCALHAQSQSTTPSTTSTASSRAAKRKAKKEAKAARKAQEKEQKATAANSSAKAAPASEPAKEAATRHESTHAVASAQPATPPSAGMVWVNTSTKVYHKSGSKWYGHTKSGKWMTEADAQKAGYKAAKN